MWGLALNDTSEDNDSVKAIILAHLLSAINEFKASRNSLYMNILRNSAVLLKSTDATVKECACYIVIPFSNDDPEAHIACVGNAVEVVV